MMRLCSGQRTRRARTFDVARRAPGMGGYYRNKGEQGAVFGLTTRQENIVAILIGIYGSALFLIGVVVGVAAGGLAV